MVSIFYPVSHVRADNCRPIVQRTNVLIQASSGGLLSPTPTVWHFNKYNTHRFSFSPKVIKNIMCTAVWKRSGVFTSQESSQKMELSALPATRSYWIRMLAISQMLCMQVKLESRELEHSSSNQKPWVWLTVFTQDIMVSCYCISFFFLLLVFSPLSGSLFVVGYILRGKKSFANKYGLCKLLLSLFTNGSVTRLAFVLSQLFSNIKWYYVSCWFSSIPSFCKIEKKCRVELLISHMNHALMCCILSLCRTSYLFCYSVIPSTLLLVEIPAFCLSPHIHINRA